jgi:hypothetical protein
MTQQRGHYHELYTNQFVREKEVELFAGELSGRGA